MMPLTPDEKAKIKREIKDWISSVSGGLTQHEKNKYGAKIDDAVGVFLRYNRYRIDKMQEVIAFRQKQKECGWRDIHFEQLEAIIGKIEEENEYLRGML